MSGEEVSKMLACACLGPQNSEPLCPCRMKRKREEKVSLTRWVEINCDNVDVLTPSQTIELMSEYLENNKE